MTIREKIESVFEGKAFKMPLFYNYDGGLRFELSEGGHYLNEFLTAHRKAMEICSEVFAGKETFVVCVKIYGGKSLLTCLPVIRALNEAGFFPKASKEYWTEIDEEWDSEEDCPEDLCHYIAFEVSSKLLLNALWCAFTSDFATIKPGPGGAGYIYMFDFDKGIMILPYDDHGMDIVGPNKALLGKLYAQFNEYLLDHDRAVMDAEFS